MKSTLKITMKKHSFSIILPLYNEERYITQCIQSIIKQTYDYWELIIVDRSNNEAKTISEAFSKQEKRIIYLRREEPGIFDARQEAIKIARGDVILFLDSDDYYDTDALFKLNCFFNKFKCDMIQYSFTAIKNSKLYPKNNVLCNQMLSDREEIIKYTHEGGLWTKAIRRNCFSNFEYPSEIRKLIVAEDLAFETDYLFNVKTAYFTNERLYFYRVMDNESKRRETHEQFELYFEFYNTYLPFYIDKLENNNCFKNADYWHKDINESFFSLIVLNKNGPTKNFERIINSNATKKYINKKYFTKKKKLIYFLLKCHLFYLLKIILTIFIKN